MFACSFSEFNIFLDTIPNRFIQHFVKLHLAIATEFDQFVIEEKEGKKVITINYKQ